MFADDDDDDRNLFKRAIDEIDIPVKLYLVENGQEVLSLLSHQATARPDVIFLDVNMPVMDGWECLKELRATEEYKNVPLIIYSTTSQRHHVKKALLLGAQCLITKPDSFNRIKEILTTVISDFPQKDIVENLKIFPEVKWKV